MAGLTSRDAFIMLVFDVTVCGQMQFVLVNLYAGPLKYISSCSTWQASLINLPSCRQAPDTFDELRTIHAQLLDKGRMAACVVVANKIDLVGERKVSYVQGLQLVRSPTVVA